MDLYRQWALTHRKAETGGWKACKGLEVNADVLQLEEPNLGCPTG